MFGNVIYSTVAESNCLQALCNALDPFPPLRSPVKRAPVPR